MNRKHGKLVRRSTALLRRRSAALAVSTCVAVAAMAPTAQAQDAEALTVGFVGFFTGAAASPFGIPARNAAELLFEAINEGSLPAPYDSKGAGGMQINPIYVDEAGGTTQQVTEYRNLVQRENADAVVGYISSGSCLAVAPVAEELKTFTVLYDCGTPRIFEDAKYQYVFRTEATATVDSVGAARYVAAKFPDAESYEGINPNYAWGQDSWRDFELTMAALMPEAENNDSLFPKLFAGQYGAEISALSVSRPDVIHSSLWGGDMESFVFQAAGRGLHEQSKLLLSTGETAMFRLGSKLPDGIIIGARGPYGVLARDSELNSWFQKTYTERFGTPPTYPSYHAANGILGLKVAYDKAAAETGGKKPTSEQVSKAFEGAKFEAFGTTIELALGDGHQAVTEMAYGISKFDEEAGKSTITDVMYFPVWCVNPPPGTKSVEWLEGGMKGAKCE